ncbi:hypothetical protein QSV08_07595 [Maribacter sp. BPC-D8]|uniref:hypothetical protein n=1 Tax=Maribacter sp. BPC-D8 TaxID=3053613 RepID=UPI002B492220|nr:hypothetical protein [Maribacter sp. BPC-D8]WRI31107.1 hypothetical protein QSV08_07595 [Maribacter sp. BPC-D8]
MNTYIPLFFFSVFILLAIWGIMYAVKNSSDLSNDVINEKIIARFSNLQIIDTEALGVDFWYGHMNIYETRIVIKNSSYSHHFVKKNVLHSKKPMTISLNDCYIKDKCLILKGTKHRVLKSSSITVKLKSENFNDLIKIKELID